MNNKILLLLILLLKVCTINGQTLQNPTFGNTTTNNLISKNSIKVELPVLGSSFISPNFANDLQQGYAFDGTNHYLIGTSKISKRDASWAVVVENNTALTGVTGANHLGDGVYLGGFLYIPAQQYPGNTAMQIAKYNATTLALVSTYDISATNTNCSAIATDGTVLYVASFEDGSKIWKYDLTGNYLGIINITTPFTNGIQGLAIYGGEFYVAEQMRLSKLSLNGAVNTFLGYVPGESGNIHRGEGIEVVSGVVRISILGATVSNIYYLNNTLTNTNIFSVDALTNITSTNTDFTKKFKVTDTDYRNVGNNELVIGNRGNGTVPFIATRTSNTTATGFFNLAIQNADVARTGESDIVFLSGFESGNSISTLATTGTAFLFRNGTTNLTSISRQGSVLISGGATTGSRLSVQGTINASSGSARGGLFNNSHVATANNDLMIGLDVLPSFTNGAFTGTNNVGIRALGSFNQSQAIISKNTLTTGQSTFTANDDIGNKYMDVGVANSAITSGSSWGLAGEAFMRGSGATTGLHLSVSSVSPIRFSTNNGVEKMRIYGSSGNVSLQSGGTFTDNGVDKLQVTGTASGTVDATNPTQFTRYGQVTALDALNVKTTGNQNIAGFKTFTTIGGLISKTVEVNQDISGFSPNPGGMLLGVVGGNFAFRANGANEISFSAAGLSPGRVFGFPNTSGTVALTSDIANAVTGAISNTNTSASSLTLSVSSPLVSYYVFTGTTATWTLPVPAGNTTKKLSLINTGTGTVTVNTNAGANVLYNSGSTTNTYSLLMGSNIELYSDGSRWIVL